MADKRRGNRRQQILEALARELEVHPEARITTARLAQVVGVSEAALYRHFPSKAKMFEALIEFAEESVFSLANRILAEESDPLLRCEKLLSLVLGFAKRNPGITRILSGDALVGENQRLRDRAAQFFQRLETQLKQVLREGEMTYGRPTAVSVSATGGLLMAVAEGRMAQFNRSGFRRSPLEGWENQWALLAPVLFPL
ncbi:MAG: nucleoid occlusion factor SlmA [Gammaproteobacteria bacterium]|nr:MAG: nucleoid occlusion factor SlmA [Gammaproteobacteria bacterium]